MGRIHRRPTRPLPPGEPGLRPHQRDATYPWWISMEIEELRNFEGHGGTGEHSTTGRRAWCLQCTEWCYPDAPCGDYSCCAYKVGLPAALAKAEAERDEARGTEAGLIRQIERLDIDLARALKVVEAWREFDDPEIVEGFLADAVADANYEMGKRDVPLHQEPFRRKSLYYQTKLNEWKVFVAAVDAYDAAGTGDGDVPD